MIALISRASAHLLLLLWPPCLQLPPGYEDGKAGAALWGEGVDNSEGSRLSRSGEIGGHEWYMRGEGEWRRYPVLVLVVAAVLGCVVVLVARRLLSRYVQGNEPHTRRRVLTP